MGLAAAALSFVAVTALCRVYLCAHFTTDNTAGFVMGLIWVALAIPVGRRHFPRWGEEDPGPLDCAAAPGGRLGTSSFALCGHTREGSSMRPIEQSLLRLHGWRRLSASRSWPRCPPSNHGCAVIRAPRRQDAPARPLAAQAMSAAVHRAP